MKKLATLLILLMVGFLAACGTGNEGNENEDANAQGSQENETNESITDHLELVTEAEQQEDGVHFHFELINHHEEDVEVSFPSGKQYDILVKKGDETIYQFSEDKLFTEAVVKETIPSGESATWEEVWEIGEDVEAGEYNVEMQLVPSEINGEEVPEGFANTFTLQIADMSEESAGENTEQNGDQAQEAGSDSNELIRNIEVTGENGNYQVTGEIHSSIGAAYYEVEDGHNYLVEKTEIPVEGEQWGTFTVDVAIAEEDLPFNGTILMTIFNEDRSKVVPVQLDQIQ
ncbi:BsuPI-related putative proteinase inhibitor [Gracilibacillus oryzae]|nr:BsuPI-related putative proteinase inhibitor [Gracilibacillus oryzae]